MPQLRISEDKFRFLGLLADHPEGLTATALAAALYGAETSRGRIIGTGAVLTRYAAEGLCARSDEHRRPPLWSITEHGLNVIRVMTPPEPDAQPIPRAALDDAAEAGAAALAAGRSAAVVMALLATHLVDSEAVPSCGLEVSVTSEGASGGDLRVSVAGPTITASSLATGYRLDGSGRSDVAEGLRRIFVLAGALGALVDRVRA